MRIVAIQLDNHDKDCRHVKISNRKREIRTGHYAIYNKEGKEKTGIIKGFINDPTATVLFENKDKVLVRDLIRII